jgi:hypothetical protein
MQGYIKLHRKILENPIIGNPKYIALWIILLMLAQHKESEFLHGNQLVKLERGQLLTGRKQLAELSGIAEGTIETILNYLESQQQIKQQKTTKYRVLTILNWDKYQVDEQQFQQQNDNKITTKRQQNDTYKNVNNVKNEKNILKGEESKDSYTNLIDFINSIRKVYMPNSRGFGYSDRKARRNYEYLVKCKYKKQDFEITVVNMFEDKFHKESGYKHIDPEFITRSDKFEKFLARDGFKKSKYFVENQSQTMQEDEVDNYLNYLKNK